uniref:Lipase n=1 Tax=Rhabditophanes sp. KR3021 TaxID=114890 RepID=A0AC35TPY9_9BILA
MLVLFLLVNVVFLLGKADRTIDLITQNGYPGQSFEAITEDGYILKLHRIPFAKNNQSIEKPIIFLQHGILSSSSIFVVTPESPAFVFADNGFDVWLGNARGNEYSSTHTTLSNSSQLFWTFSWDEMAKFDIDAMINRALEVSGAKSLNYLGHNEGSLVMLAKLATDMAINSKIDKFFALAPIGTLANAKGGLPYMTNLLYKEQALSKSILGTKAFIPSEWLISTISHTICQKPADPSICKNMLFLLSGTFNPQLNISLIPIYTSTTPSTTSTQNMIHYMQMVQNGKLQMFDYRNNTLNQQKYDSPTPPSYDLSKITKVPIYLYFSEFDFLADKEDVQMEIINYLDYQIIKHNEEFRGYGDLDFIWGTDVIKQIYLPIVEIIKSEM